MDLGRPTTMTEAQELVGVVYYYRDMWTRWSLILSPIPEAARDPKVRKIIFNDALEDSFKELTHMVSTEILVSYPDSKIPFRLHTDAHDKQLSAVISQNNKPISLLSRRLSITQHNYTMTYRELLVTV